MELRFFFFKNLQEVTYFVTWKPRNAYAFKILWGYEHYLRGFNGLIVVKSHILYIISSETSLHFRLRTLELRSYVDASILELTTNAKTAKLTFNPHSPHYTSYIKSTSHSIRRNSLPKPDCAMNSLMTRSTHNSPSPRT